ncbi:MAG: GAF domain-containing protein [Ktedonobacterales bacterium]
MVEQLERPMDSDVQALTATLDRLVQNVGTLIGVPSVSVALLEPETGDLVTWAALGAGPNGPRRTRFGPNEGIAGWVAAHLEPVIVHDVAREPRFKHLGGEPAGSMLCVPLIDNDQLLGTLTVSSPQPHAFDMRRQQLLQIFSDQAVLAISKTRQAEAAKAQARELGALLDATRALTSSLELTQVFAYIVASIRKVIACDDAVIYSYDEHAGVLRVMTGFGRRLERLGGGQVNIEAPRSMAAWVAKNRRARLSAPQISEVGEVTEAFLAGDELALLCVPLVSKDQLRGVIMLAREDAFSPSELGVMLNLSNIVAATLENVQLYQTARAEREQQAALYAAASDAIAVVDGDLRLVEANDSFTSLTGRPRSEILGQMCCEALHAHTHDGCPICDRRAELSDELELGKEPPHIECDLPDFGGIPQSSEIEHGLRPAMRYIDFSVTPVSGPQGRRLLLVGRDVTAFREMDQMKANFIGMVSHELRSPLQVITGYLDLTLSGMSGGLTDQQFDFLRRARAGSEHLMGMVDDLLLISRRDAGLFTLSLKEIELVPVIQESIDELELLADDSGVKLYTHMPAQLPPIWADGPRISQVLRNLLTNAIKFTPAGGSVTVSAEATDDSVIMRVRDTGVGIAPQHLKKIFDRYYQIANSGLRGRFQGQGLGLAIVRMIVEGHHGNISVESNHGQGSVFMVVLPRRRARTEESTQ